MLSPNSQHFESIVNSTTRLYIVGYEIVLRDLLLDFHHQLIIYLDPKLGMLYIEHFHHCF